MCVELLNYCNFHGVWYQITQALYKKPNDAEPYAFIGLYAAGDCGDFNKTDLRQRDTLYNIPVRLPAQAVAALLAQRQRHT